MSDPIVLKITGRKSEKPEVPSLMRSSTRSVDGRGPDAYLPPELLKAKTAIDVSASTRGSTATTAEQLEAADDEVLVIELADGGTLITSPSRMKAALQRNRPDLVDDAGHILFDRMNVEGALQQRSILGGAAGSLVTRVVALAVNVSGDKLIKEAETKLAELLSKKKLKADATGAAALGVSWLGTKALMWAVENRLPRKPGLYPWGNENELAATAVAPGGIGSKMLGEDGKPRRALIFIHGTGSSTLGSFGDLQRNDRGLWTRLESRFPGGIYGLEHYTLSESPIENALQLVDALPKGALVSLVTHSRGGLVGDLLCLRDIDQHIDTYGFAFKDAGDPQDAQINVRTELDEAHAEHREQLRKLFQALRDKAPEIQSYVRVASPAQGTKLASGNFDVFLSGLLTLIGHVPYFFGNPLYSAFKRVVIEIARNRTNPHLVPGIEAMLPDSPMAALLRDGAVQPGIAMALIAGDIQGGNLLMRMGVMLTDFLLFENTDNDLVVNTAAMLAGIATKTSARVLFDRAADVSHFNYFGNLDTRSAMRDWLLADEPKAIEAFRELPSRFTTLDAAGFGKSRDAAAAAALAARPVVVVLPGVMGTCLRADDALVWLNPLALVNGGVKKIAFGAPQVTTGDLFGMTYGAICERLAETHRVVPFPYDWRQPLDVLGERLGEMLDGLLKDTERPVRLLAHSMGGLVVRSCIYRRRDVMDRLMGREGARLVMCGTPHQGAHSMVENMLGKGGALRTLARLDVTNGLQSVLDVVAGFRGALQLLPRPGFVDTFEGQDDGGETHAYGEPKTWIDLQAVNTDLWFGDKICALPDAMALKEASWLWSEDAKARAAASPPLPDSVTPALPDAYRDKSIYIFGVAPATPCGVRLEKRGDKPRLRMVATTRGDGTVTWDSGRIGGIGSFYYLPVVHGDLLSTAGSFAALTELLLNGATNALDRNPPKTRDGGAERPTSYDPGPPSASDAVDLAAAFTGGTPGSGITPRAKVRLQVNLKAMDLRFLACPIMVGHYENDSIAGTEALVDTELMDGQLAQRKALDLYAGPLGTAAVVLRAPSALDRRRGVLTGAVVTGLGRYEGNLTQDALMLAVRAGVMRFLLQVVDVMGREDREVSLATLLLGYNSSASLSIAASVEAIVRGVVDANEKFRRTTGLAVRIAQLDLVELYLDTAITAVYELRQLAPRLLTMAASKDTLLTCGSELIQGIGVRQRLFDNRGTSTWPRLIVTDAEDPNAECPPGCTGQPQRRSGLANRLRFLYVGQRARAETVVQQRQPSLIETLVRQQITQTSWNQDFGRMLFQLIVPPDFKDAARQLQRVVLVVDSATANLPWELMLTDPLFTPAAQGDGPLLPLAVCTPVVRQLSSSAFRRDVRQSVARNAYVVGNPSVEGFAKAFPDPAEPRRKDPPALGAAEEEANAIATLLASMGYEMSRAIGADNLATDVLSKLYRKPYRILHVSAHGVFDLAHVDGLRRSGVVLSGGLLITAAEIAAMESVPELVFLNCCHLGKIDATHLPEVTVRDGNKLAASVARELIDIGVRCVLVAGWAVDDKLAQMFGEVFYKSLLQSRRPFGTAVFDARQALWAERSGNVTWGAFQAYGDPLWMAEPEADGGGVSRDGEPFVSLDEMLDELARTRVEASRRPNGQPDSRRQAFVKAIEDARDKRCPPAWLRLPALQSALGASWRDLGCLDEAYQALRIAVRAVDVLGRVPIRDIEQLAAVEVELGASKVEKAVQRIRADQGNRKGFDQTDLNEGHALIQRGIDRLESLDLLISDGAGAGDAQAGAASAVNAERFATLGNAYKTKATAIALQLLRVDADEALRRAWADEMDRSVKAGVDGLARAQGTPGAEGFRPYCVLNGLALRVAGDGWDDAAETSAAVALARQCGAAASRALTADGDPWDVVVNPESLLVERLRDGQLGQPGDAGKEALDEVLDAYRAALDNLGPRARHIDAAVAQMDMLATLFDARFRLGKGESYQRMAGALLDVAGQLRPGRDVRDDRPKETKPLAATAST
ncbi:CHAT domain-containing protein [Variovorax sp. CF079]|uniref:CHAT domain-containing protein n=1 Tax=Variovorax sp. CF079 TaxID=1882774 RepID=UPI00088DC899|nr:CHAT domain-containing protein [Variovorax sp. CF079]SDC44680.1 CHAT domain-containing protein [Variovorax sp. CF079]